MKTKIFNFIGSLVRDVIVCYSGEFVEYTINSEKFIYKSFLPFSFGIGKYRFLTKKEYDNLN